MGICKKKILFLIIFLFFNNNLFADTFDELKNIRKTSYLDFIILKIEQKLIQRHGFLRAQAMPLRIQYQNIGSQVNFIETDSKIEITIMGVMDKRRYSKKKYTPKVTDCNVLRNLLLYKKYGYNIFQKKNSSLTGNYMKNYFKSIFLSNLSLSDKEQDFIIRNIKIKVNIVDPVRGNDLFCSGLLTEELS
jgi:hypothetical protein